MGDVLLPSSVRVGYAEYAIVDWSPAEAETNSNDGECLNPRQIIRVRADLPKTRKANVLLHEIFHAAYSLGDLASGDSEEKVVTVLSNQMTQVWRDNPDFVAFMSASLKAHDEE